MVVVGAQLRVQRTPDRLFRRDEAQTGRITEGLAALKSNDCHSPNEASVKQFGQSPPSHLLNEARLVPFGLMRRAIFRLV